MSYQQVAQHCSTEPHAWAYDHMWHIGCIRGSHIRGGAAFDSNMDYTDIQYGNWTVSFRPIMLVAKLTQFSSEFVCCGARLVASPSDARCARPCRGLSCLPTRACGPCPTRVLVVHHARLMHAKLLGTRERPMLAICSLLPLHRPLACFVYAGARLLGIRGACARPLVYAVSSES